MLTLTYDIIACIVQYVNIGSVSAVLDVLGTFLNSDERDQINRMRTSCYRLFQGLVDDPNELLKVMLDTRSVLSGSRALDYFVPGSCSVDSDWDFYCPYLIEEVRQFTSKLKDLGVTWNKSIPESLDSTSDESDASYEGLPLFTMISGTIKKNGRENKVQVMWKCCLSATQSIVDFHSSAAQCFVSGFAAGSFHHYLTSRNLFVAWSLNDRIRSPSHFNPLSGINEPTPEELLTSTEFVSINRSHYQKYVDRGFKLISWKSTVQSGILLRERTLGDNQSMIVPLTHKYLDTNLGTKLVDSLATINWVEYPQWSCVNPKRSSAFYRSTHVYETLGLLSLNDQTPVEEHFRNTVDEILRLSPYPC